MPNLSAISLAVLEIWKLLLHVRTCCSIPIVELPCEVSGCKISSVIDPVITELLQLLQNRHPSFLRVAHAFGVTDMQQE